MFTVMSALATQHQAINLGQGFLDFPYDRHLIAKVNEAMLADHNQYPPLISIPSLRNRIAQKIQNLYGLSIFESGAILL